MWGMTVCHHCLMVRFAYYPLPLLKGMLWLLWLLWVTLFVRGCHDLRQPAGAANVTCLATGQLAPAYSEISPARLERALDCCFVDYTCRALMLFRWGAEAAHDMLSQQPALLARKSASLGATSDVLQRSSCNGLSASFPGVQHVLVDACPYLSCHT
jgi:hypothetical protein